MVDVVCPFCQNTGLELRGERVSGFAFELPIVRCSACGAPFSVLQGADIAQVLNQQGELIRQLSALVKDVHRQLGDIEGRIQQVSPQRVAS
jgi:hypothetical protein